MKIPVDQFEMWLINKNLKERTIENYLYYFNKFTYDRFNQESVSRYLSLKSNRNSIARSFLVNLKRFLLINHKELHIDIDYYQEIVEIELPKLTGRVKQRIIIPLSHEQIFLIEKYLKGEKLKLQLLISYFGALRLGELLKIRINDFNWEEWKKSPGKIGECRVYGKGDKEGIALLPSFLMMRVATFIRNTNYSSVNSPLFFKEFSKFKNHARIWQMRLRDAGIKAGITKHDSKGQIIQDMVVHPHRLRHSYANYLLKEKKLDIRYVQEILRHSSIQSTQIYTKVDKEELKEKLEG